MKKENKSIFMIMLSIMIIAPVMVFAAGGFDTGIDAAGSASWLPTTSINIVIKVAMLWLLRITAFVAIIALAIAGILYMTSAGDDEQITKAKKTTKYALIGIIVAISGSIILTAVTKLLSGSSNF